MPVKQKNQKIRRIADRYRVERELGRGGAGVVYLARDEKDRDQAVALKVRPLQKKQDPALALSLKNEFATLSLLKNRNLAEVYDFGITEKEIYFSSEWIEGVDILKATEKANLNTIFQLTLQILKALDFLHRRGVLHLDLKPANLLVPHSPVGGDLSVKVIDFGIAEWKKKGREKALEFSGTPPYAAPEIILEKPVSPASDLYSLGVLFHQIFFKKFPFRSHEPFEIMKEQIYQDPIRVESSNPALPEDFSDLLLKMVAQDPAKRFQSAREVLEAVNQSLGENFTLRSSTAPVKILEESDLLFRKDLFDNLEKIFSSVSPQILILSGPAGIGKSHMIRTLSRSLQLKGLHPYLFRHAEALEEFLKNPPSHFTFPLFIDLEEKTKSLSPWIDALAKIQGPVLLATRVSPSSFLKSHRHFEMKLLTEKEVGDFLKNEIADFPGSGQAAALAALGHGLPTRLEKVLQALREENFIHWTERGWHWRAPAESDLKNLLERQEVRVNGQLKKIQEILKFSPIGMDGKILEGILGLETGSLQEKWPEWERVGELRSQIENGQILYFSKETDSREEKKIRTQDWSRLQQELIRLYDEGAYPTGKQCADWIFHQHPSPPSLPEGVVLYCARHWVRTGEVKRALDVLPETPPQDEKWASLYHEIRALAFFYLGKIEAVKNEIRSSEILSRKAKDRFSLARIFNLKGMLETKLSDYTEAVLSYEKAMKEASADGNVYFQGLTQMNRGTLFYNQGDFDQALRHFEESLKLSEKARHPFFSCILLHNRINLLYHMGRADEAEKACYEWLQASIRHHYLDEQAAALTFLALLAGQKNQSEAQLGYLNQAIDLLKNKPHDPQHLQSLIHRGFVYDSLEKWTAAQLDGEAALEEAEKQSYEIFITQASLLLGKVFRDRPRPDLKGAEQFFQKAFSLAEKVKNRPHLWQIEMEWGLLMKKQDRKERANELLRSARKHLESLLASLPEAHRQSYLRDRKLEKLDEEIRSLEGFLGP